MRTWLILSLAFLMILSTLFSVVSETEEQDSADELIAQLERRLEQGPAYATADVLELMRKCAETKRLDAAYLLVKALSISHDPQQSDDPLSEEQFLPSISLMRKYFGELLSSILFAEGIATDMSWYRNRLAFATKAICSKARIQEMIDIFSLTESKNIKSKEFLTLLSQHRIDLYLDLPSRLESEKIDKAIDKIKERRND